ncbi:ABC transporter permease [Sporofaciens musculi]|uniref:ABC transporter permease n=1 Tax=Sporofaciens musculi TaxID=2681861 RepID=UPI0025707FAA|nr:ABC transporter permease [Sporofaciens musculi]
MGKVKQLIGINLVIFMIFSCLRPERFLTGYNFESMCFQFPEAGILTLGIGITMLTAGADLSIVAVANLTATVNGMILLYMMPEGTAAGEAWPYLFLCLAVTVLIGLVCGMINGFLVAHMGIFPILATLGTQNLFMGVSMVLTKGQGVFGVFPEQIMFIGNGKVLGIIPMPLVIFLAALAAVCIVIHHTVHGIRTQLFGSNRAASFYCGIDNVKTVFKTYMISSMLGALTGILILARTNSAKYDYGSSYVLQAMLASVFAGISPLGGKGNMLNILLSATALQMLDSGFNLLRISSFVRSSTYGILLIIGILLDYAAMKYQQKKEIARANKSEPVSEGK